MKSSNLQNTPNDPGVKMPKGIPFIIGNELAERFSFYGMKAILFTFMTSYLLDANGQEDFMTDGEANGWIHTFVALAYLLPVGGALLADIFWGKYRTIIILSIVYCAGHAALAINETRLGLLLGLTMIAIGTGGIKPCVSAHVGDQFGPRNKHLMERVFSLFYLSINLGATVSIILTPYLLDKVNSHLAFGLPGALMILATLVFWLGNKSFVSIPPVGWKKYKEEVFTKETFALLGKLVAMFVVVAIFWSLFDQQSTSWIAQGSRSEMLKTLPLIGEVLPAQMQSVNTILILILVPIFTFGIYKKYPIRHIRRIAIGLFIAPFSFVTLALVESHMNGGNSLSIAWQGVAYFFITTSEVLISVSALEFAYTQAPKAIKSLVMSFYLLSVFLGNGIAALFNFINTNPDGTTKLSGPVYFWFFAGLMVLAAFAFLLISKNYKDRSFIQGENDQKALAESVTQVG